MFRNRRQLRRWAARVLLVWLFGVVTGVANACWTESLVQPSGQAEAAQPECEFHAASHAAAQDGAAPDSHGRHAQAVCQAYCDGFSVSMSPLKPLVDTTLAPAMLAPFYAVAVPVADVSPVHRLMQRRDGWRAPPITIAFLRLTL